MRLEPNNTGLPDEALTIAEDTSTPNVWDEFYALTHKNAKASWDDVAEEDDADLTVEDDYSEEDDII